MFWLFTVVQQTVAPAGDQSATLILALASVVVASALALAISIVLARRIRRISNQQRPTAGDQDRDATSHADQ